MSKELSTSQSRGNGRIKFRKIVHYPETPLAVQYQNMVNQGISIGNVGRVVSTGAVTTSNVVGTTGATVLRRSGALVGGQTIVTGAPATTFVTGAPAATYVTSAPSTTYVTGGPATTYVSGGPATTYISSSRAGGYSSIPGGVTYVSSGPAVEYVSNPVTEFVDGQVYTSTTPVYSTGGQVYTTGGQVFTSGNVVYQ